MLELNWNSIESWFDGYHEDDLASLILIQCDIVTLYIYGVQVSDQYQIW